MCRLKKGGNMKRIFIFLFMLISCYLCAQAPNFSNKKIDNDSFKLFCGNSNPSLAQEVAYILGVNISKAYVGRFNDGEIKIRIEESIREKNVYIIQSICSTQKCSVNDNLMELFLMIRACKRASAKSVIAVIPYFGYARQDRKMEDRVPISASDIAMLLEQAGADQIITLDLHCEQIQGFFHNSSVDNLKTSVVFVPYFERKVLKNLVVVAPDAGALSRAKNFIDGLNQHGIEAQLSMIVKQRLQSGVIDKMYLVGDVKGCDVLIVDDICDTGGTLLKAAKELKRKGANKVYACITHPVFSKDALNEIQDSALDELIVTDTIPLKKQAPSNIVQVSIAPLVAEAIKRSQNGDSLLGLFKY
jgi:ribose-phosphate pyrophosphokinase